ADAPFVEQILNAGPRAILEEDEQPPAAAQIPVDRLAFPITERVHGPGYDEHLAIRWDLVVLSGKGQGVHLDVVLLEDGGEVAISGVLGVALDVVFAVAGEKQHAAA